MITPWYVEVGEVPGPAGSGVAGDLAVKDQARSSLRNSSSEDITLT